MRGMSEALKAMRTASTDNEPLAVYYAYKQSEDSKDGVTSAGWASFLQAVVDAGLAVDGTWPIRTELSSRLIGKDANALASSIVHICRKRASGAPLITRAEFVRALKRGDSTPSIVGFYQPTSTTSLGFLDVGGTITPIDPFGSTFTQALGVNDLGEIVGFYVDNITGVQHGYIDNGGVFTSFDPSGSVNTTINGVNDLGDIVGFFTNNNDSVLGFVGTPVPEPSTWAMMLLAFPGFGFLGYRKACKGTFAA